MSTFWHTLPKPFFALAPMEDVTDAAFRRTIASKGKPHVMFTEFTSADGLALAPESGQKHLRRKLLFSESERPIVAQLFSAYPERMERAAQIVADPPAGGGFDGIDINMGCPANEVVKTGCGAAMIQNPSLAREIIRAAKRGVASASASGRTAIPISVKTRIGYASNELETWLPALLSEGLAAITIHARTRNEMSDVPARWDTIKQAVAIRDAVGVDTLIIGNGDVQSIAHARERVLETGCDGVMLARAIYGDPWLFAEHTPTPRERVEALAEHIRLFDELLGIHNFAVMKKHFKAYISGWDGAKELRVRLMETQSAEKALQMLASCAVGW